MQVLVKFVVHDGGLPRVLLLRRHVVLAQGIRLLYPSVPMYAEDVIRDALVMRLLDVVQENEEQVEAR